MNKRATLWTKTIDYMIAHLPATHSWLTHHRLPLILACAGIMLILPALGSGWVLDDYWHKTMFSGQWPRATDDASLFGLFTFMDGTSEGAHMLKEAGIAPWWVFDGIKMAFWRPLSELTHWIDYQLWPESPWLMHLHSFLWFGLTIWLVAKLYRRIIGLTWVAGLAGLLFAVDNTHMFPAGFIANRNTLIAGCFGCLALLAYVRWSQYEWTPGGVLGPICYLLALFAKESALAIGAYVFAYTLVLDKHNLRRKVIGFLPYVVITFGWFFTYRVLDFGTTGLGIDLYIDPGRMPLFFLKELLVRLPIMLLAQFTGPPAEIWGVIATFWPFGKFIVGFAALVILGFTVFCLFPLFKRDAVSRFWLVGMLFGLIPVCAAFPSSRELFFAGIGAMGIIARFLSTWFDKADWLPERQCWKRSVRALCVIFVIIHLVVAPITLVLYTSGLGFAHYVIRNYAAAMPYDETISEKTVVLLNPPIEVMAGFISQVRAAHGEAVPARIWSLGDSELTLTFRRLDEYTLDVKSEEGLLQTGAGHILRGPSHPMYVGQRIELSGMSVEVLALADNWQPSHVRFTFNVPLGDPSLVFLQWEHRKFVPSILPAIGESEMLLAKRSLL